MGVRGAALGMRGGSGNRSHLAEGRRGNFSVLRRISLHLLLFLPKSPQFYSFEQSFEAFWYKQSRNVGAADPPKAMRS